MVLKCKRRSKLCYLIKTSNYEENHHREVNTHNPLGMTKQRA